MKNSKIAYQWDFDGVLADNAHRRHLAPADFTSTALEDWATWSAACLADTPIAGSVRRMQLDYAAGQVHIVSSRSASAYQQSRTWLSRYTKDSYDYIRLRGMDDRRKGWEIKVENIFQLRADGIEVVLAYEDLKSDAEKIYEHTGVPVVLINPAYDWVETLKSQDQPLREHG